MIRGGWNPGRGARRGRSLNRPDLPPPRERSPIQKILRRRFQDLEAETQAEQNDMGKTRARANPRFRSSFSAPRPWLPGPLLQNQPPRFSGWNNNNNNNNRPPAPFTFKGGHQNQNNVNKFGAINAKGNGGQTPTPWDSTGAPPPRKLFRSSDHQSPWEPESDPNSHWNSSSNNFNRSALLKPDYVGNSQKLANSQKNDDPFNNPWGPTSMSSGISSPSGPAGPGAVFNPLAMGFQPPRPPLLPPPPPPPPLQQPLLPQPNAPVREPPPADPTTNKNFRPGLSQFSNDGHGNQPNIIQNPIGGLIVKPPVSYNVPGNSQIQTVTQESIQSLAQFSRAPDLPNRGPPTISKAPPPPKIRLPDPHTSSHSEGSTGESSELRFIELTASHGICVKSSPSIKCDDAGSKLYCFNIEFGRDDEWVLAAGPYLSKVDEARERAYEIACVKAREYLSSSGLKLENPEESARKIFPSQKQWPHSLEEWKAGGHGSYPDPPEPSAPVRKPQGSELVETPQQTRAPLLPGKPGQPAKGPLLDLPTSRPGQKPLLECPPPPRQIQNPLLERPPSRSIQNPIMLENPVCQNRSNDLRFPPMRYFEDNFKDIMDTLHMQCWLKLKSKTERGEALVAFEVEVQSYDKKFHEFYGGGFFVSEDVAKESAFETACAGLKREFPKALENLGSDSIAANQRKFMDLRSALGLNVRCIPETKLDAMGNQTFAFNVEFYRGSEDPETVYGEFGNSEKGARERAFELAVQRVKYLFGPELEHSGTEGRGPNRSLPLPTTSAQAPQSLVGRPAMPEDLSNSNDWNGGQMRLFNPHSIAARRNTSLAMVPPLVHPAQHHQYQQLQPPQTPFPTFDSPEGSPRAEYGRTHEYRFKELANLLNMEFNVRKIPQFEGGHRIFAYEVKFQGKSGNFGAQKLMGEYSRDEGSARESAFKYATEQLSSNYGYQLSQLGLNPQCAFGSFGAGKF